MARVDDDSCEHRCLRCPDGQYSCLRTGASLSIFMVPNCLITTSALLLTRQSCFIARFIAIEIRRGNYALLHTAALAPARRSLWAGTPHSVAERRVRCCPVNRTMTKVPSRFESRGRNNQKVMFLSGAPRALMTGLYFDLPSAAELLSSRMRAHTKGDRIRPVWHVMSTFGPLISMTCSRDAVLRCTAKTSPRCASALFEASACQAR